MTWNERIVSSIMASEGWPRFSDDPSDSGGATKGGITLDTLRRWRRDPMVDAHDLRQLTEEEARHIYHRRYIERPGFDGIRDGLLRYQVVDAGVLSGSGRATRWLQQAAEAGLRLDGVVGPLTLAAVNGAEPHVIALRLCSIRSVWLADLVQRRPKDIKWVEGWIARSTSFLYLEAERCTD